MMLRAKLAVGDELAALQPGQADLDQDLLEPDLSRVPDLEPRR
jgi:hypothetical protein